MPTYKHYRHKTDPMRFLYHEDGKSIRDPSPDYAGLHNWVMPPLEEFNSIEQIPPTYREAVRLRGYCIYSKAVPQ